MYRRLTAVGLVYTLLMLGSGYGCAQPSQREFYRDTLLAIKIRPNSGHTQALEQLQGYPLLPYLQKAQLERQLHKLPVSDVDHFLQTTDSEVASRKLRQRWLTVLAQKKRWQEFLNYYREESSSDTLRCHYLEALYQTGKSTTALALTNSLWRTAHSLPNACDAALHRWQQAGYKTDRQVWQRLLMAAEQGNRPLTDYLASNSSQALKPFSFQLLAIYRNPTTVRQLGDRTYHPEYSPELIARGLALLSRQDIDSSIDLWRRYQQNTDFSTPQKNHIIEAIARQLIAAADPRALHWLIVQDPDLRNPYLSEWRIRLAIQQGMWRVVQRWIELMGNDEQQQPRWRYWLARALAQNNAADRARRIYQALSGERHFYAWLSARQLQTELKLRIERNQANQRPLPTVSDNGNIRRAYEFYQLGQLGLARSEWNSAMRAFDHDQRLAAAQLADQWGWHSQAIQTALSTEQLDDLALRFPLAYVENMSHTAEHSNIPLHWLYAIARQESAFARDARSPAGARGVMQIRPSTARAVARSSGIHFSRTAELYRPEQNIRLGGLYLKQLLDQFDGNQVLATAAYNAGPQRIQRWLERQPITQDLDIWIETLPFYETRSYIQNVLIYSAIYREQLKTAKISRG